MLKEAKINAIKQTEEIQLLFNSLDEVSEKSRQTRLVLERQIRTKKQKIKDDLILKSIADIQEYIDSKSKIFNQLDNSKYFQHHQYEYAIKGKSSIISVKTSLKSLVQNLKSNIDDESERILRNLKIVESIPSSDKILFQDVNYLVALPEKELALTIENRRVKFSEQQALKKAETAEKELYEIDNEALSGNKNEEKKHYIISIELLSTRQKAIDTAREIKKLLNSEFLVDMKLTNKRDI